MGQVVVDKEGKVTTVIQDVFNLTFNRDETDGAFHTVMVLGFFCGVGLYFVGSFLYRSFLFVWPLLWPVLTSPWTYLVGRFVSIVVMRLCERHQQDPPVEGRVTVSTKQRNPAPAPSEKNNSTRTEPRGMSVLDTFDSGMVRRYGRDQKYVPMLRFVP